MSKRGWVKAWIGLTLIAMAAAVVAAVMSPDIRGQARMDANGKPNDFAYAKIGSVVPEAATRQSCVIGTHRIVGTEKDLVGEMFSLDVAKGSRLYIAQCTSYGRTLTYVFIALIGMFAALVLALLAVWVRRGFSAQSH